MKNLTLSDLERHWVMISRQFRSQYRPWVSVYSALLETVGGILGTFEGRRRLPENCSYLLLSKAINHSLSMYTLADRGLCIDASLSARNALETLLFLQLCTLDPSEDLFRRWSNGESFQPAWVRRELDKLSEVQVRDVVITRPESDDTYSYAYKWLSQITHANLASLEYSTREKRVGTYEVAIGGDIGDSQATINAIFALVCSTLLFTTIICGSVFSLEYMEDKKQDFSKLQKEINGISKSFIPKDI